MKLRGFLTLVAVAVVISFVSALSNCWSIAIGQDPLLTTSSLFSWTLTNTATGESFNSSTGIPSDGLYGCSSVTFNLTFTVLIQVNGQPSAPRYILYAGRYGNFQKQQLVNFYNTVSRRDSLLFTCVSGTSFSLVSRTTDGSTTVLNQNIIISVPQQYFAQVDLSNPSYLLNASFRISDSAGQAIAQGLVSPRSTANVPLYIYTDQNIQVSLQSSQAWLFESANIAPAITVYSTDAIVYESQNDFKYSEVVPLTFSAQSWSLGTVTQDSFQIDPNQVISGCSYLDAFLSSSNVSTLEYVLRDYMGNRLGVDSVESTFTGNGSMRILSRCFNESDVTYVIEFTITGLPNDLFSFGLMYGGVWIKDYQIPALDDHLGSWKDTFDLAIKFSKGKATILPEYHYPTSGTVGDNSTSPASSDNVSGSSVFSKLGGVFGVAAVSVGSLLLVVIGAAIFLKYSKRTGNPSSDDGEEEVPLVQENK